MKTQYVRSTLRDKQPIRVPSLIKDLASDLAYAELWGKDLSSLVLTTAGTWYLLTNLTIGYITTTLVTATVGAENSKLVPVIQGLFLLNIHASIVADAHIDLVHMGVFKQGTLEDKLQTSLETDTAEEAMSITGLVDIKADDALEVKFKGATNGTSIVVKHIDFNIVQIGW